MDDIKLFAKKKKRKRTGNSNTRSQNIQLGYKNGIWHRKMWHDCKEKWQTTYDWRNGTTKSREDLNTRRKRNVQILGILEADTIKQMEMKNKIQKECLRRTRKLVETELSSGNLIKGMHTRDVFLVRYLWPFLKWTRDELKKMDERTRKLMIMNKTLHPIDDDDRLYIYQEKRKEEDLPALKTALTHRYNDTRLHDNTMDKRMIITWKQKLEEKQLYGCFKRQINNISQDKTWTWLRKDNYTNCNWCFWYSN